MKLGSRNRRPGRSAWPFLVALSAAAVLLAGACGSPAVSTSAGLATALAAPRPRPPGWNKHPPLPAHTHPPATGVISGWQLALMAVTVVLLAAVLITIAYPGPDRPAAAERTRRLSDDHQPRHADPHDQPAALATPTLARQNHRPGPRP